MIRDIEFKVGLFITIATLLILGALLFIAYHKGFFSKVYTYTLSSKTGENLTEGMPVVFWGFNIGRVSALELTEQGVMIQIKIPERHNRVIRTHSRFILDKPLLGTSRIVVLTPDLNEPPLSTKSVPEIDVSDDINELIKQVTPIAEKVDLIAANVAAITGNLADPQGEVRGILKNVEQLSNRFAGQESLLEMAIGNSQSVKSIQEALMSTRDIMVLVEDILKKVDKLAGKVDGLAVKADEGLYGADGVLPMVRDILRDLLVKLQKIDKTLDNFNKVSDEVADSTEDLKVLRSDVDDVVTSVGKVVEDLDRLIPFKNSPEIKLP